MQKKYTHKQIEKKMNVVRRGFYVFSAFFLFQLAGIFSLAGIRGLYVVTENKSNAFYPKTYVDIDIVEDNEDTEFSLKKDGTVYQVVDGNGKGKNACVINPGSNKKSVVVRARIVAEIYNASDDTYLGTTQDYTLMQQSNKWIEKKNESGNTVYYYTSILPAGGTTEKLFDGVQLTSIDKIPDDAYVKFHVIVDTIEAATDTDGNTGLTTTSKTTIKDCWGSNTVGLWGITNN